MFAKIAVPRPLDSLFDYEYNPEVIGPLTLGDLVWVPFGSKKIVGVVIEGSLQDTQIADRSKIKSIDRKLLDEFSIPSDVMDLCKFGAAYYQHPIGEALQAALPPKAEKDLASKPRRSKNDRNLSDLPALDRKLTDEQQSVLQKMLKITEAQPASPFLLEGVTGSGKTEIYIELARKILSKGQSVLILVPEIALTSHLKDRFSSALQTEVALWHSALAEGLRQQQWKRIKNGEIKLVVGARSALFAPLFQLGLIVVDEEHDATYKQEERFRYQARDLAIYRAKRKGVPIVLGTATPSIESLHRAHEKPWVHLKLENRYSTRPIPEISWINLGEAPLIHHESVKTVIAEETVHQIQAAIDRGEQAMIYLNRRGFSQFILCKDCGWIKRCDSCSISMTHYQRRHELRCHLCGAKQKVPVNCEECDSSNLVGMGSGTEALESELEIILRDARVARLDRDQITSQKRLEETLDDFRALKFNVLVGTQMLVKGHDFPKVTCVVVLMADLLLKWPDFRASERALQTLTQVAGRSGRSEWKGEVIIQGYDLNHPVIQVLKGEKDKDEFLAEELEMRRELRYPPFSRMARFRFEDSDLNQLKNRMNALRESITVPTDQVLGPSEALVARANGKFRFDFYVKARTLAELTAVTGQLKRWAHGRALELTVDVDPYSA